MKDRKHVLFSTLIVTSLSFQGCAIVSKRDVSLTNPTPIHQEGDLPVPVDPNNLEHRALEAHRELPLRYYQKLDEAKKLDAVKVEQPDAAQAAIDAYVKEGTALVEIYCLRWFGRIADAQRGLTYSDSNWNVIRQLGTALIGIGKLNPNVTAVYGAGNTAWEGFRTNVHNVFLAAPSAENVKKLTMQAVKARADLLNDESSAIHPKDFATAYLELEKLADTCTYSEIKNLTTQAVAQSQGKADPQTGETFVVPTAEATFLKDNQGDLLRTFWKPDGKNIDKDNQEKIRDWMKKHGLVSIPITGFLRGGKYATHRQQATKDLGL